MKYFQPKLLCSLSAAPLILVISCQILLITSDQVKMNDGMNVHASFIVCPAHEAGTDPD